MNEPADGAALPGVPRDRAAVKKGFPASLETRLQGSRAHQHRNTSKKVSVSQLTREPSFSSRKVCEHLTSFMRHCTPIRKSRGESHFWGLKCSDHTVHPFSLLKRSRWDSHTLMPVGNIPQDPGAQKMDPSLPREERGVPIKVPCVQKCCCLLLISP